MDRALIGFLQPVQAFYLHSLSTAWSPTAARYRLPGPFAYCLSKTKPNVAMAAESPTTMPPSVLVA
jgi:hypothetical protein